MPRPRNELPTYRLHKPSGQAIVTLRNAMGDRQDVYLGVHGSKESWEEYKRVTDEWRTSNGTARANKNASDLSVTELCLLYWKHVEATHVRNGEPAETQERIKQAIRHLRIAYGSTLAREFGPLALEVVRERFVDHECQHCKGKGTRKVKARTQAERDNPPAPRVCARCQGKGRKGYVRRHVNRLTDIVKGCFKWGVARQLVPVMVWQSLLAVEGLRKNRGKLKVREHKKVKPATTEQVEATMKVLTTSVPSVVAMIRLQSFTGMRSEELCLLTAEKIDRTGAEWYYRPSKFKGDGVEDAEKVIVLGPRAQEVLKPFVAACQADEYLFSPRADREARYAVMRAKRKSKVQPSQVSRKKAQPIKPARTHYTPETYAHCIARACKTHGIPHWSPHMLRHSHGTAVRAKYGLEAAQIALGHASADITQVYAERDMGLARRIAREVG